MKLLITGAFKYTDKQIEFFKKMGFEVVFVQNECERISFPVYDIDAVICNGLFLYNDISAFTSLKFIQLLSAGLDRVPLDYIKEKGIKLYNARGVYSVPMAEFALCGILQLYKQSRFFLENQKARTWEKHRDLIELGGKKALIIGTGSVGCEVAKRLNSFDVDVTGIDIVAVNSKYFNEIISIENLDKELIKADIVLLTLPLTQDNMGFFDKSKFSLMKSDAVFVNIARGALVNEQDLINALNGNAIGGAVLDVFEMEPLDENSPLWNMENVILTPHNSFVGENNGKRMFELISKNLEEFL